MTFGDRLAFFFSQPRKSWTCKPCTMVEHNWKAKVKGPVKGKEHAQFTVGTVSLTLPRGMRLTTFLQSFISLLCSEGWRKCTKNSCSLQNGPRRLFAANKNFHPSHLCPINLLWRAHIFKRQFSNTSLAGRGKRHIFVQLWSGTILQICPLELSQCVSVHKTIEH